MCVCVLMLALLPSGVEALRELGKEGDDSPSSLELKARRILNDYLTTDD